MEAECDVSCHADFPSLSVLCPLYYHCAHRRRKMAGGDWRLEAEDDTRAPRAS